MPIKRNRYPKHWAAFSKTIRVDRAHNRCECVGQCGLHQPNPHIRRCIETHGFKAHWARGQVILTTAHLCECDPPCALAEHVIATCQRCHLRIDVELHARNSRETRKTRKDAARPLLALMES